MWVNNSHTSTENGYETQMCILVSYDIPSTSEYTQRICADKSQTFTVKCLYNPKSLQKQGHVHIVRDVYCTGSDQVTREITSLYLAHFRCDLSSCFLKFIPDIFFKDLLIHQAKILSRIKVSWKLITYSSSKDYTRTLCQILWDFKIAVFVQFSLPPWLPWHQELFF